MVDFDWSMINMYLLPESLLRLLIIHFSFFPHTLSMGFFPMVESDWLMINTHVAPQSQRLALLSMGFAMVKTCLVLY